MRYKSINIRAGLRSWFPLSIRGWLVLFGALGAAALICFFLMMGTTSDVHVPMIFVLAVLVVSLMTEGYFYAFPAVPFPSPRVR